MIPPRSGLLEGPQAPTMHDANTAPERSLAGDLALVLEREARAVGELREALSRQREGVARNSTGTVNSSCDDIGRILVSLEAARRARAALLGPLAQPGEAPMDVLERAFGGAMPEPLAAARRTLRGAAEAAAREAAINRVVLRRTIESGEAFLQALFSNVAEPESTYRAGERPDDGGPGFLLDRKA
jgi:hypothetical protein